MNITYRAKGNIYLNITSRCPSDCAFCLAKFTDKVYGYDLKLAREPDLDEVLGGLELAFSEGPAAEVVFVGLGEPSVRLDLVLEVVRWCRPRRIRTRLVTNGHGQLINPEREVVRELALAGLNAVSISLVAHNPEVYNQVCRPLFSNGFSEAVRFAQECVSSGIETELTFIDLPEVDIEDCRNIAERTGARFRLRPLIDEDSKEVRA
ncbi:MAG: radical SAM protein [Thermoleophilia bacterium]|nr:radical SAM protein [Thermoleophilia bacterium]